MRHVVGVADRKLGQGDGDLVVTHALGSCLGIAIYDPAVKVGGILHAMLPYSQVNPEKASGNPYMFVDSGTPAFFKEAYALGAVKERLIVKVAGGASLADDGKDLFAIGKRNFVVLRKLFWQNNIMIAAQDVGGHISRTLYLDLGQGRTWLQSRGREWEL